MFLLQRLIYIRDDQWGQVVMWRSGIYIVGVLEFLSLDKECTADDINLH